MADGGFVHNSVSKESACNAGDPGSIPELGRSAGEGIGHPLQYSWAPCGSAGKESACNVGDLGSIPGLGRSPGEGKGYHCSILAWRIPWTMQPMGSQRVGPDERLSLFSIPLCIYHPRGLMDPYVVSMSLLL